MNSEVTVSVIIPAYNEEAFINDCINSIHALDYPAELIETIVVDNGSTDTTVSKAKTLGTTVIDFPVGNVGAVRNTGAKLATGDIVAFIDADCCATNSWLTAAINRLADETVGAVGGICTLPETAGWVEKAWTGQKPPTSRAVEHLACSSFIMKTSLFRDLGGFNETLTAAEDDEMSARIRKQGYKLFSEADCAVIHNDYPSTLTGIFKKQLWHGSNQIDSSTGLNDILLLATHLYLLAGLVSLCSLPMVINAQHIPWYFLASCGLIVAIPTALAFKKQRGDIINHAMRFIQLTTIFQFYFCGRAIALLKNYYALLFK